MKRQVWLLGMLAATAVAAQTFYLQDEQGQRHGPFVFRDGEKLAVGDRTLTLSLPSTVKPSLGQKLEQTVIPSLNFRETDIADAVEFLRQASIDYSPFAEPYKGVNLVLNLQSRRAAETPRITFSARGISLGEALDAIVRVDNLRSRVQGNVIMIEPLPPPAPAPKAGEPAKQRSRGPKASASL